MTTLLALHAVAALAAHSAVRRWGRRAFWLLAIPPAIVFGWALAHVPSADAGAPTREALAERYAAASGRDLTHVRWYQAFALWKLAVVIEPAGYEGQGVRFPGVCVGTTCPKAAITAADSASLNPGTALFSFGARVRVTLA